VGRFIVSPVLSSWRRAGLRAVLILLVATLILNADRALRGRYGCVLLLRARDLMIADLMTRL
jgi:hypothetical protein